MPAILCPRCGKLISSNAPECPFCGKQRPGMWGLATGLRRLGLRSDFPRLIMWVCIGVYVLALASDPAALFQVRGMMGLLAPSRDASVMFGMTGSLLLQAGHWWTVVTAIYLHGNLLHIFFNMMWVRQLGPVVEDLFGPYRLFVIFTVAGAAGFLLSAAMGHAFTLGASGSIFGLLAAAIAYGRRTGAHLFTRQFLQWAVVLFIFGLVFRGVDNWAHAGGFAGGYAMAFLYGLRSGNEGLGSYLLAALCLLLTVSAFALQAVALVRML
ncbi:MAG: rhomboid family intramembrane serine protease [Candidatus Latescibacterota bacterium]